MATLTDITKDIKGTAMRPKPKPVTVAKKDAKNQEGPTQKEQIRK